MQASISYLKDHLSEVLKAVQLGEEIYITSHHRRIAKITLVVDQDIDTIDENKEVFIQQLQALQAQQRARKLPVSNSSVAEMRKKERY